MRDSRLSDLSTTQIANETISAVGTTAKQFGNTWVYSIGTVTNASSGNVIPTSNYTTVISSTDGTATIVGTGGIYNNQNWNVTYNIYNTSRADWTIANKGAIGLGEYGNWFKIIVIVAVAAVVLGIIFAAFGRGSGGSEANVNY